MNFSNGIDTEGDDATHRDEQHQKTAKPLKPAGQRRLAIKVRTYRQYERPLNSIGKVHSPVNE